MTGDTAGWVPVFSSQAGVGGVEAVAGHVHAALTAGGHRSSLYQGLSQITRSRRPRESWFAATWKVHAAVTARHPQARHDGFILTHGAELTRDSGRGMRRLRQSALDRAERLLAVSPLSWQLLPPPLHQKLLLVGPPIPASPAPPGNPTRSAQPARPVQLLSIGRATPRKGHDTAIAVARALARHVPVVLRVVGPGPDLPRLRALAADPPTGLVVQFLGQVTNDVKLRLFQTSDALLFLARTEGAEFEGLGLVVLEAAAQGCPAVVLDCGGSRYTVSEGRTGYVLPEDTPACIIAGAASAIVAQPAFRTAALSYAGRFNLPDWQRRICAVLTGSGDGWEWPDVP